MKKFLALSLAVVMLLSLCACGGNSTSSDVVENSSSAQEEDITAPKTDINIAFLKGPTGLGALKLLEDNEQGATKNNYNVSLVSAPEEIVGKITSKELDIAAVPTNLAATLFAKTNGGVKLIAINTQGVLYLLTNDETVTSLDDLKGKSIYATGQGSTPEYLLNFILEKNNLSDNEVIFKSEHAELATLLASQTEPITALLPEPFVTSVMAKSENVRVVCDLTEEWNKQTKNTPLSMGVMIARTEFLEQNKDAVLAFLEEYNASTQYVNNNVADAAALSEKFDIMAKAVAEKAIPRCNIVCIEGKAMVTSAKQLLEIFYNANPNSVGGSLPDESFYYQK